MLLACYGSPDERQIDGIGGADPLTSKAAIVGRSAVPGADVDYTFCQVGIAEPRVSTGGNCGNMLAAVGPFALLRGLIKATEPETVVRIYTTNTKQIVTARVPVVRGRPAWEGACRIAGVPGSGASIRLDFGDCSGALSGRLLPSGNALDEVDIGDRTVRVSLIDAATPFVFVDAREVGAKGTELPQEIQSNQPLMERLEAVRAWATMVLGLAKDAHGARNESPNVPRVMMVTPPAAYRTTGGEPLPADAIDVCARQLAMQRPHKALAVTGAVCIAVAASVPGSVVADSAGGAKEVLRVGHPSGVLLVSSRVRQAEGGTLRVESAVIERTARLIMAGAVYARKSRMAELMDVERESK